MLATVPCVRLFECWQLFKGIVANVNNMKSEIMEKIKLRIVGQVTHTYIIKELLCPKCGAREEKRYRDDETLRKMIRCKKCRTIFELCE